MADLWTNFNVLLGRGIESKDLTLVQMSLRGLIVLIAALVILRLGSKRALAQKTAFDTVLLVVLASVLARGINGNAGLWPTIGASFVFVLVHRLIGSLATRSHALGCLLKGRPQVILRDGQFDRGAMRRNHISEHDFEEDMRVSAEMEDKARLKTARVERSGDISFIKKEA